MNWDDARIFLTLMRSGSLAGAADSLGCSRSTVRRHLERLEAELGSTLFVTARDGLVPTDAARGARVHAEQIEHAVDTFRRRLSGHSTELAGTLTITTVDALSEWFAPALAAFRGEHPEVAIQLILSTRYLDLAKKEIDVAIRATNEPDERLFGRRVDRFDFAPFAARSLVAQTGASIDRIPWVLYTHDTGAVMTDRWYREAAGGRAPFVRVNTPGPVLSLVRSGHAGALLPAGVASDPSLVQLGPVIEELSVDVWCLTHNDLRDSVRIRAMMDFITEFAGFEHFAGS